MKERPILFSAPMVQAILKAQKTMTRRVVKPQPFEDPKWGLTWEPKGHASNKPSYCERNANWNPITNAFTDFYRDRGGSPYGHPGDRLWVRESWQYAVISHTEFGKDWEESDSIPKNGNPDHCFYRADDSDACKHWWPSIFMPRWASRITLEVMGVSVARVQDISAQDAASEGIQFISPDWQKNPAGIFAVLWDSINADRGFGWDKNPWVWAVSFKVL